MLLENNAIRAGVPEELGRLAREYVMIPRDMLPGEPAMFVKVVGDSMQDVGIMEGDKVLLAVGRKPYTGDIVAALIDGMPTLKSYYEADDGTCWLISQNKEKEDVYRPILLDERNNAMIQGVVTEMTKSAPRVSQAMLSKRLGDAEKRMPSKKKLLKAISQTYDEGLWWGSTAWATVYRALKYDGSMSAFAREMQDLLWGMDFVYEPTADSISKPLRDGRMMAEIGEWEANGVAQRNIKLAKRLRKLLNIK
ncbi:MAG: hypothetical protein J6W24_05280 [Prevotella sp.]|nr:hypothetical protein [Prevotella sp.]